jgi:ribA/ribD-fused uncharacterized protein
MIDSFQGKYRFLSNFYPSKVTVEWETDRVEVPTVEHGFQAMKATNRRDFDAICNAPTPGIAKRMGKEIALRLEWNAYKIDFMEGLLRQKFSSTPLRDALIETGNEILVEGNDWGDTFWGICGRRGENHLGQLLMKIRDEIKDGKW